MVKSVFGKKIGMTQIFTPEGEAFPVTLVEVEPVYLLEKFKRREKEMARVGCFELHEKRETKIKKPQLLYFKKQRAPLFKMIREIELESLEGEAKENKDKEEEKSEKKDAVNYFGIEVFQAGEKVTIRAKTKGKGFTGAVKRHSIHRQPSSHGSGMHRRTGSIGASATPSRVMKNKKMPGHMGARYATMKNLEILRIEKEKRILFIKGSVPGSRNNLLKISKQAG